MTHAQTEIQPIRAFWEAGHVATFDLQTHAGLLPSLGRSLLVHTDAQILFFFRMDFSTVFVLSLTQPADLATSANNGGVGNNTRAESGNAQNGAAASIDHYSTLRMAKNW